MKKLFITFLSVALLLSAVGCSQTPPDVPNNTDNSTKNTQADIPDNTDNTTESTQADIPDNTENTKVEGQPLNFESSADIYLCDDVDRTKDTPTHGIGTISLLMAQDVLTVEDFRMLLCDDECEPAAVVGRASQGYSPVYSVVADGELDGTFRTLKFKLQLPERMVADLKNQGDHEELNNITERLNSNYYYLLVLDETHYAYIHLARKAGTEKAEGEAELADSIVKNAKITFAP